MGERRTEVGACGNHCAECLDYRALAENSDVLCRKVAANLTKELNRPISPLHVGCEGCWGGIHNDVAASLKCRIRQCASLRHFCTCAECDGFPCDAYLKQFSDDSEYALNLRAIKSCGLDEWIARRTRAEAATCADSPEQPGTP